MFRKGQIETIFGILGVIFVAGAVVYGSIIFVEQKKYFLDLSNKMVFDRTKCNIDAIIKPENQRKFDSLEEAHKEGFKDDPNCI